MRDNPAVASRSLHDTTAIVRNRPRQHIVSSAVNEVEILLMISADVAFKLGELRSASGFVGICGVLCKSWCESCYHVGRGKHAAADCATGKVDQKQCDRRQPEPKEYLDKQPVKRPSSLYNIVRGLKCQGLRSLQITPVSLSVYEKR